MIAKIGAYLKSFKRRAEVIREARKFLAAVGEPAATGSDLKVLEILMTIGLGHLRALKGDRDAKNAAREIGQRIMAGPRPSFEEAGLN